MAAATASSVARRSTLAALVRHWIRPSSFKISRNKRGRLRKTVVLVVLRGLQLQVGTVYLTQGLGRDSSLKVDLGPWDLMA